MKPFWIPVVSALFENTNAGIPVENEFG